MKKKHLNLLIELVDQSICSKHGWSQEILAPVGAQTWKSARGLTMHAAVLTIFSEYCDGACSDTAADILMATVSLRYGHRGCQGLPLAGRAAAVYVHGLWGFNLCRSAFRAEGLVTCCALLGAAYAKLHVAAQKQFSYAVLPVWCRTIYRWSNPELVPCVVGRITYFGACSDISSL